MELLAEGGYMVGKLAQLLYPGITIEKIETAVEDTRSYLQQKDVCLHEATIEAGNKIRFSMPFYGRIIANTEVGKEKFQRLITELGAVADIEKAPSMEGKMLTMLLKPKST